MPEYFIGLISGTSMDGIDAALVDFSSGAPELVEKHEHPWPDDVRQQLLAVRDLPDDKLHTLRDFDIQLGEFFAEATLKLLDKAGIGADEIIAIGNHGQTIRHRPEIEQPFTLQIGDAQTLANITGIRVIDDFRSADVRAGGQGAPLAPAFHEAIFRNSQTDIGVLNLGGFANLTLLPADPDLPVTGFDTGPASTLLDVWMLKTQNQPFDKNGDFARSGEINNALLAQLLSDDYFEQSPPKSTGFELFNLDWLNARLDHHQLSDADVQATLCELSARSVADAVKRFAPEISQLLVCGGGVHNVYLMERIQTHLPSCKVESTKTQGLNPDFIEAMLFAWLAKCRLDNEVIKLSSITGASQNGLAGEITEVKN